MDLIIVLLLAKIIIVLIYFEYKIFKTCSPSCFLAIPYIITSFILFVLHYFSYLYYSFSLIDIAYNFLFLILFQVIGFLTYTSLKNILYPKKKTYYITFFSKNVNFSLKKDYTLIITLFNSIIIIILFFLLIKTLFYIKNQVYISRETLQKVLAYGFIGHFLNFLLFYNILILSIKNLKNKITTKLLILIDLILLLLRNNKYYLMINIISIFLALANKKFNIKKFTLLAFFGFVVFYLVYFIFLYILNIQKNFISTNLFILKHLIMYLVSPIYNSILIIEYNLSINDFSKVLPSFINIINFISGNHEYVTGIVNIFIPFYKDGLQTSNVFGFFGDILLKTNSYSIVAIITTIIAFLSYLIFFINLNTKFLTFKIANNINLAILSISFFSFWYGKLFIIELMIYLFLLFLVELNIKSKKSKKEEKNENSNVSRC
jgi:hypothetical protein